MDAPAQKQGHLLFRNETVATLFSTIKTLWLARNRFARKSRAKHY
jgi:hypothetical protein